MTATEELRRMLDEREVEWESTGWPAEHQTFYEAGGVGFIAIGLDDELGDSRMRVCFEDYMTPEQAIAATLGDGEYERKMDALLCRLTNGKFSKTRTYDLDFMESVVREEFETDAAELEAETCHLEEVDKGCDTASEYMIDREWCFDAVYRCSCGYRFGHVAHDRPNFCPNCGCRVKEVE